MGFNPSQLLKNLQYVGEAPSKKRTYYVYQNVKGYFHLSSNKETTFNITLVDRKSVEWIYSKFKGKQEITVNDILPKAKKANAILGRLEGTEGRFRILSILYVLVAEGRVNIDDRFKKLEVIVNFRK